jgi:uncharacterized membrane protein YccF (DUF307 family)
MRAWRANQYDLPRPLGSALISIALINRPSKGDNMSNMRLTKSLGMLLLGIWLIVTGLLQVVSIPITGIGTILAVLAIAAGVLILLGR